MRTRRLFLAVPVIVGLAACDSGHPPERLGEVAQPVWHGTDSQTDFANTYNAVAALNPIDCSGTLVTPNWILTAAHCFTGRDLNADVFVRFNYDPGNLPDANKFQHTAAVSGPVLLRRQIVDYSSERDIAEDMALFRLDARVPASVAKPIHLPLAQDCTAGAGALGFTATTVGFGYKIGDCDPIARIRRYSTHDGWFGFFNGGYYRKVFSTAPGYCYQYSGAAEGDSGGAFIDQAGELCGVVSGGQGSPFVGFLGNVMAATDDPVATQWLTTRQAPDVDGNLHPLLGADGQFDGECKKYVDQCYTSVGHCDDVDTDGDGVVDVCDDCADIYDPAQAKDPANGAGVACDYCPGTAFDFLKNRNYKTELGLAYPGKAAPTPPPPQSPTPAPPPGVIGAQTPNRDAADAYRLAAFRPDACDPTIVPVTSTSDVGADEGDPLPPAELPPVINCLQHPCNCPAIDDCSWQVTGNELKSIARRSDGGPPAGTPVTIGYRACGCTAQNRDSAGGFAACQQQGCTVDPAQYGEQGTRWQQITTETQGPWVATSTGAEFDGAVEASQAPLKWDFLTNTAPLVSIAYNGDGLPIEYSASGILWATMRRVGGGLDLNTQTYGQNYFAIDADAALVNQGSGGDIATTPDWLVRLYCPSCPEFVTRLSAFVDDPQLYEATPNGAEPVAAAPEALRELYAAVGTGQLRYLEASEPLTVLAKLAPARALLQGVALDSTLSVAKMYQSASFDAMPVATSRQTHSGTPELEGNEGILLASTARRVFVVGGTSDGTPSGNPADLGWMLDVDVNTWQSFPLAAGARPGAVLAATFRVDDARVYVVDEDAHHHVRLRRWRPGEQFETLALLPASWSHFDRSWLVAGPGGDLVFAVTRAQGGAHAKHARFARFLLDADDVVTSGGIASVADRILAAPMVNADALSLVVPDASGGRLVAAPLSAFAHGDGDEPDCHPSGEDE